MNPYVIIGFLLALAGSFFAGDWHGHSEANKSWTIAKEKLEKDAATKLLGAQQALTDQMQAYSKLAQQTEDNDAKHRTELADAEARADRAIAAAGGLRDKSGHGGGCTRPQGPPAGNTSAPPPAPADGCVLSDGVSQHLRALVRRADDVAAYANSCYAWITGLKEAYIGTPK